MPPCLCSQIENGEFVVKAPSVLCKYYREETLASDRARQTFVMPDALS